MDEIKCSTVHQGLLPGSKREHIIDVAAVWSLPLEAALVNAI